jgi:peptidyl-dipeptidase Dcp
MSASADAEAEALLRPWDGPLGGLPPFDRATPALIERAYRLAVQRKRAEVRSIASDPRPPTLANTLEALEDCGRELRRVDCLYRAFSSTMSTGDMPAVAQRLASLQPALEDEIAHDAGLFARVDAVHASRAQSGLDAEQRRLVEVVRERMVRAGAALPPAGKARLAAINGRLAELSARFSQNLIAEQGTQAVFLEHDSDLAGLGEAAHRNAAAAAAARGRPGQWAVPNERPAVWAFLTHSTRRDLREQVWRMWTQRGDNPGEHDNKPVIADILRLRGEKARLLGFPSFAHLAFADRMAGTPQRALDLLRRTWASVLEVSRSQLAEYQAIAASEGHGFRLAPWDRLHYAEKLRQARFGVDGEAIKGYFPLEAMLQAMFWAAGRVHGLSFEPLGGVPVLHPSVRVFEVRRGAEPVGVVYFDLFNRPGRMHGSYQQEYRTAERFRGRVLPISSVNSSFPPPAAGEPVLLPWEYANVFFHEFGHALHVLLNGTRYPSLASAQVAWDLVELPALLNERWLRDRDLLQRFARHPATGEPIPEALLARMEQALRYDRIFSVNLDYLAPAIVDLELHLLADGAEGREIDAVEVEARVLRELGMPEAWDLIMRVTHSFHSFIGAYGAGVYVYLWADVMAADVAEAFERSPGGLYDADTAERWRRTILSVGHSVPADEAFRRFRGRDPDPAPLLRRFGLETQP